MVTASDGNSSHNCLPSFSGDQVDAALNPVVDLGEVKFSVMPIYGAPDGLLARLYDLGVGASCRTGLFGCEKWIFKKNGEVIFATQNYHSRKALVLTNPTGGKVAIVDALVSCGLLKHCI